eukprot:13909939-Alexandrium_andersonii.AAC.1
MSASLVGSEMCIRDRLPESQLPSQLNEQRMAIRKAAARLQQRRQARPVSYTHLTLPTICSV